MNAQVPGLEKLGVRLEGLTRKQSAPLFQTQLFRRQTAGSAGPREGRAEAKCTWEDEEDSAG